MTAARNNVLKAVSTELGMSQSQLQSQLHSGKSLSQVATAAGVSSDQLNATITGALKQSNLPAGTDIAALSTKMAAHVGGHHHHGVSAATASASATTDPTTTAESTAVSGTQATQSESTLATLLTGGSTVDTYL
jgi:hypothetical protein